MKKVRNWLLLLLFSLVINFSYSQHNLRIEWVNSAPYIGNLGDTFQRQVNIINDSSFAYTDVFGLGYRIITSTDSIQYNSSNDTSGIEYVQGNQIPAGGTYQSSITVHVSSPQFKAGPSVVVIWPMRVSDSTIIGDSIRIFLNIDELSAIAGREAEKMKAFVLGSNLYIQCEAKISIKRVRIYDVLARQLLDVPNPANSIPLPVSAPGIYVAEIIYNNKQRQSFRFYR